MPAAELKTLRFLFSFYFNHMIVISYPISIFDLKETE